MEWHENSKSFREGRYSTRSFLSQLGVTREDDDESTHVSEVTPVPEMLLSPLAAVTFTPELELLDADVCASLEPAASP